jgi:putative nucleotidyltransferase with HDIG domain
VDRDFKETKEMKPQRWNYGAFDSQDTDMKQIEIPDKNDAGLTVLSEITRKLVLSVQTSNHIAFILSSAKEILNASASSVILVDEKKGELFFEFADGNVGGMITQVRLNIASGIAGWVAREGKPLIVNDVKSDQRFSKDVDRITGFATRSIICVPILVQSQVIGVIEVVNRKDGSEFREQDLEVLKVLAKLAATAIDRVRLNEALVYGYINAVNALATTIDNKDPFTREHSYRVKEYALMGARSLQLPQPQLDIIEYAGLLHDVGKIIIPNETLRKSEPLTPEEWAIMRKHPSTGADIIATMPRLEEVGNLVRYHHERYDGKGYPEGLNGEEIPIGARLLAVADAFDTMTTKRSYRNAVSLEVAVEELRKCSGKQFSALAVEAFICGVMKQKQLVPEHIHAPRGRLILPNSPVIKGIRVPNT